MNKLVTVLCGISGLLGLALTTRTDITNSLLFGIVLIIVSGALFFVALKTKEQTLKQERLLLLEDLSINDIKQSFITIESNITKIDKTANLHHDIFLEQLSQNKEVSLCTNKLLEQLITLFTEETKTLIEQQATLFKTEINEINSKVLKSNVILEQIAAMIQSESTTFIEQQQNLYEIILSDVGETLTNFSDNQSQNADNVVENIKRIMRANNDALKDIPFALEKFSSQNAELIKNAANGYKQFELLMNSTLEQMTSISNQDYNLLKEMME